MTDKRLLTTKQLQARLVDRFGEGYRYTEHAIRAWVHRDENPLPALRTGTRGRGYRFVWSQVAVWLIREAAREKAADAGTACTKGEGIQVTLRALARELGSHVDTVRSRVAAWNIKPVTTRLQRGGPVDYYRLREILKAFTASARPVDPDDLPPKERDAYYRAELRKDELRRSRQELVEVDDCRRVMELLITARAGFFDVLVDALEHRAGLEPEHLAIVEKEIERVRELEVDTAQQLREQLASDREDARYP